MLHQASQRANMQGRFKPERPNLSHTNLHPEITKGGKDFSPESSWEHKKQHADIKAIDEEELVKYMSKLPSYLERGAKKPQEKVLNVGVLEWGRLEKWQGSHKQISHRSSISSLSSSNTSSSLSTDESSARSSTGHSCSPGHQRLQRPSLESHSMSVPKKGHLQFVKPFRESGGKFQDLKTTQRSTFTVQEKFIREKSSCKSNPHIKPDKFKRREMLPKIVSESGTVPNGVKDNMGSCEKVKMKNQRGEFMKKAEIYQEVVGKGANQDVTEKRNTVVLLLPRDLAKTNHSGAANLSDLTTKLSKEETEPRQRTSTETFKEAHRGELSSSFYHSGPLRSELDGSKHLQIKAMGLVDANNNGFKSERSQSVPRAAKVEISSSRSRNLEEKMIHATNTSSATNEACKGLETKVPKVASEKVRSTSPFRRFSFSMGKSGKSSGLKEGSSMPQMSSTCSSAKTKPENLVTSGVDTSCGDKLNAKSRARSSPLRRLIEPLLKPKAVNCRSFTNQLQESIITEGGCKSSERTRHSTMTMQPAKVKSDTTSTIVNDSAPNKKCGSSAVQALLRVQIKNGLPLFTFAVDNESNILVATVKMLSSSSKGDYGCIYTFFAVKEVRKKNSMWINQGGKGKGQDYAPKIVAQMKVSGSEFSHLSRPNHVDQFSIREFVLLTLDVGQAHTQASDSQPNDEQAAIIVKIPKKNSRNSIRDGYLIDKRQSLPESTSKECLPDLKLELNSGKKDSFEGVRDINATVILPSGVHSLPNKGEPSSLIQRWNSGGACDCGGWDLGCKLRILSNKSQRNQRPDFNAELQASIQKRRGQFDAKSISEVCYPEEDRGAGFPVEPSKGTERVVYNSHSGQSMHRGKFESSRNKKTTEIESMKASARAFGFPRKPEELKTQTTCVHRGAVELSRFSNSIAVRGSSRFDMTKENNINPHWPEERFNSGYNHLDNAESSEKHDLSHGLLDRPKASNVKDEQPSSKESAVGYVSMNNRIHYSGPLMPRGGNLEEMLKEHERRIQNAVRRARSNKTKAKINFDDNGQTESLL